MGRTGPSLKKRAAKAAAAAAAAAAKTGRKAKKNIVDVVVGGGHKKKHKVKESARPVDHSNESPKKKKGKTVATKKRSSKKEQQQQQQQQQQPVSLSFSPPKSNGQKNKKKNNNGKLHSSKAQNNMGSRGRDDGGNYNNNKRKRNDSEEQNCYTTQQQPCSRNGFALQLPSKHAGQELHKVPWMKMMMMKQKQEGVHETRDAQPHDVTTSDSSTSRSGSNNSKRSTQQQQQQQQLHRLPTDDVDEETLQLLNEELHAFANYVRLTPSEQVARQKVIDDLTELARRIPNFAVTTPSSRNADDGDGDTAAISFCAFGSYAAPAVCTFGSDVDLALWGAVSVLPNHKQKKLQQQQCNQQDTLSPLTTTTNVMKRERLQKWQAALAALDVDNVLSPGDIPAVVVEEGAASILPADSIEGVDHVADDDDRNNHSNSKDPRKVKVHSSSKRRVSKGENGKDDAKNSCSNKPSTVTSVGVDEDCENDDLPLFVLDRVGDVSMKDDSHNDNEGKPLQLREIEQQELKAVDDGDDDGPNKVVSSGSPRDEDDGDSSDNDSADKLVRFESADKHYADPDDDHVLYVHPVDCDDGDDGEGDPEEFHQMEVGFFSNHDIRDYLPHQQQRRGFHSGLGSQSSDSLLNIRKRDALGALSKLERKLRQSNLATSITFIRRARVPIIKFQTKIGVEVDVSIGGLNGADTSLYAARQASRYMSFAPVVLLLKIIMGQQNLDIPFEGGLGSFKLYVLVAHHIQQHLKLGGLDQPGEILLSFLFRYGGSATGDHCVHPVSKTELNRDVTVKCQDTGCNADMSNVFLVAECCHLFGSVWKRLWSGMRQKTTSKKNANKYGSPGSPKTRQKPRASLLAELVHVSRLTEERQQSLDSAADVKNATEAVLLNSGHRKHNSATARASCAKEDKVECPTDLTATELAAGYGVVVNHCYYEINANTIRPPRKRMRF